MSILLDAGPCLNFLAVGQENILVQLSSASHLQLATPARVSAEIEGMARDPRFSRTAVGRTWATLRRAGRVQILSDDLSTPVFAAAVGRISGMPARERVRDRKSLGEILVLAHASVLAQQGVRVVVLIDDGDGRRRAGRERQWLLENAAAGTLELWSTPQVLAEASRQPGWIRNDLTWEAVYDAMTAFDDGLPARRPR